MQPKFDKNTEIIILPESRLIYQIGLIQTESIEYQCPNVPFFEKMSFKEIGEIYGITEDNAKTKVYRILKRLKKIITLTQEK